MKRKIDHGYDKRCNCLECTYISAVAEQTRLRKKKAANPKRQRNP